MKDTQKEMTTFFEEYATTDDVDVEDELNQLADEMDKQQLDIDLPDLGNKEKSNLFFINLTYFLLFKFLEEIIITKPSENKPVTVQKQKVDEDALNEFLMG
jgi:hypothetical protein